jgi:hypothetical protein
LHSSVAASRHARGRRARTSQSRNQTYLGVRAQAETQALLFQCLGTRECSIYGAACKRIVMKGRGPCIVQINILQGNLCAEVWTRYLVPNARVMLGLAAGKFGLAVGFPTLGRFHRATLSWEFLVKTDHERKVLVQMPSSYLGTSHCDLREATNGILGRSQGGGRNFLPPCFRSATEACNIRQIARLMIVADGCADAMVKKNRTWKPDRRLDDRWRTCTYSCARIPGALAEF